MSKAWRNGSNTAWRKTRAYVLARDNNRCRLRLPGCTTIATQVHHELGREAVGDNPNHLIAACRNCNLKTGDPRRHDPPPKPKTQW